MTYRQTTKSNPMRAIVSPAKAPRNDGRPLHIRRGNGWLRILLLVSVIVPPVALGTRTSQAQGQTDELVIVTSGGSFEQAMRKNFYDAFTAETHIKVKAVSASYAEQWAKARAMAQSGQTAWDIVTVGVGEEASNRELLQKMDCAAMPKMATDAIPKTCRDYTVLRTIGGTVLAFNTEAFPQDRAPRSWADFWDAKKFPGPRALPNYGAPYIPMALALVADGVDIKDVTDAPIDISRALRKLDDIKADAAVWWKTGDQSQQALRNGDVLLSMMWSGRALQLQKAGQPIGIVWNGASVESSSWGVLKDAPNKTAAIKFLNFFVTRPEAHLAFSKEVFWDTPNRDAIQKTYGSLATFTQRFDRMITYDSAWLAANRESMSARWNEWLSR
jgi:mannopine transport system substrate-binding protein